MNYLIIKFLILFLLASAIGFLIGRWWVKRKFLDVTESFETLSRTSQAIEEAPWSDVLSKLDGIEPLVKRIIKSELDVTPRLNIPKVDLSGLSTQIRDVESRFADIPQPQNVDLSPIYNRILLVEKKVMNLSNEPQPEEVDLGPVLEKIEMVEAKFSDIPQPEKVDFTSINRHLDRVESMVSTVHASIKPVDLEEVYSGMKELEDKIDSIPVAPTVDLISFEERLSQLETAIINIPEPVMPEKLDLHPVFDQLKQLDDAVKAIPKPKEVAPVDLSFLHNELISLKNNISELPKSTAMKFDFIDKKISVLEKKINTFSIPNAVDLKPVNDRLMLMEVAIKKLVNIVPAQAINLTPIKDQISKLDQTIHSIPASKPVDIMAVNKRLLSLEKMIQDIPKVTPLKPIDIRLAGIEKRLEQWGRAQQQSITSSKTKSALPTLVKKPVEPQLLKSASYGKKDDLKLISGVGPKLEALCNKHGVYYFWQVASWSLEDIKVVDERLDAFKGRIKRDDWVSQAKRLQNEAGSAKKPEIEAS